MDPEEFQRRLAAGRAANAQNATFPPVPPRPTVPQQFNGIPPRPITPPQQGPMQPATSSVLLAELLGGQGNQIPQRQTVPMQQPQAQAQQMQPFQGLVQPEMMFGGMTMNPQNYTPPTNYQGPNTYRPALMNILPQLMPPQQPSPLRWMPQRPMGPTN